MASSLDLLFETRTLLEAINSPDLETEPRFLIDNFWQSGTEPVFGKTATWEFTDKKRRLSRFRPSGAQANVVSRRGRKVKEISLPYIREKTPLSAPELFRNSASFGSVIVANGGDIDQARERILNDDLTMLRTRIEEREEWMAAQLLTTPGVLSYEDEDDAWVVDMEIPSDLIFTLTGDDVWGGSTAGIVDDIEAFSQATRRYTGTGVTDIIMGTNATRAFRNDANLMKQLDNNNFRVGQISVDFGSNLVGRIANVNFWTYSREYSDENDVTQDMWPADVVVGLAASFKRNTRRLYGAVEEVEETFAAEFFSKSWVEQDPSVRWILGSARPMPIIKQIGSFVKADVM